MDFASLPLFNVMKAKLNYASERQGVLARNIANADTPGYRAGDVAAPDFKKMVSGAAQKLPMMVTDPGHILSASSQAGIYAVEKRKSTNELNPNGNNVAIDEEMMNVAQNQAEYQKTLTLYRKTIELFKVAIGRPTGA